MNEMVERRMSKALQENLPEVPETFDAEIGRQLVRLTAETKRNPLRYRVLAPVCVIMLVLGIATALAATNDVVNAWLYEQWPEMALALMPVNLTSDSQGIRMEVISAVVENQKGLVTYSMQDMQEDRINPHMHAGLVLYYHKMKEASQTFGEPYYDEDQKKLIFSEYFEVEPEISHREGYISVSVTQLQGIIAATVDLLPMLREKEVKPVLTDVPEDAWTDEGSFPDFVKILESDGSMNIPIGEGNHVFLTGIGMEDGRVHVQYHVVGNAKISGSYTNSYGLQKYSYIGVQPWVNLQDPEGKPAFSHVQHLTWGRGKNEPDDDYWEEWIFTLDRELTDMLTFNIQTDEYKSPISGEWTVDIPLRLVRYIH